MIYIHIPFCRSFCTYCGFYSELLCSRGGQPDRQLESFAEALSEEYADRMTESFRTPDTLYIGGGTPSVLPFPVLSAIVRAVSGGGSRHFSEFTVEVNPDDIISGGYGYVENLLSIGAGRISMGIQSLDDGVLKWMNRRHDSASAVEAYSMLRRAGVANVSIDLIFGASMIGNDMWRSTLEKILAMPGGPPDHVSAYQLSVEPDTALDSLLRKGRYREADEEACGTQYGILCDVLGDAGYHHYEVSNFALPGKEAAHNSAYWSGLPYLGLGPGAHSYSIHDGVRVRSWNLPSVRDYTAAYHSADASLRGSVRESETLTEAQTGIERIMLSLRTDAGIPEEELWKYGAREGIEKMLSSGNIVRLGNGRIRIPEEKFFISDSVIAGLI